VKTSNLATGHCSLQFRGRRDVTACLNYDEKHALDKYCVGCLSQWIIQTITSLIAWQSGRIILRKARSGPREHAALMRGMGSRFPWESVCSGTLCVRACVRAWFGFTRCSTETGGISEIKCTVRTLQIFLCICNEKVRLLDAETVRYSVIRKVFSNCGPWVVCTLIYRFRKDQLTEMESWVPYWSYYQPRHPSYSLSWFLYGNVWIKA